LSSEVVANLCPNLTALLRDQKPIKISHHLQVQLWNMIWQPNSWTAQNNILAHEFSLWIRCGMTESKTQWNRLIDNRTNLNPT